MRQREGSAFVDQVGVMLFATANLLVQDLFIYLVKKKKIFLLILHLCINGHLLKCSSLDLVLSGIRSQELNSGCVLLFVLERVLCGIGLNVCCCSHGFHFFPLHY